MYIQIVIFCVALATRSQYEFLAGIARRTPFALSSGGKRRWKKGCCCVLGDRGVMDLQRKTSEAFQLLGAEDLPEDWVARCWEENFCESSPLPSQVGFERASY